MSASNASNRCQGPASIAELARALSTGFDNEDQESVDLVFEWVHNNIEFTPTYGVQKGALGCLIDGFGNSFDQSALMVAVLRELGYTANHVLGQIELSPSQVENWLGVDTSDPSIIDTLLTNGGIPHTINLDVEDALESVTMNHMWVKVQLSDENWYVWDPAFKAYNYVAGIDLAAAMDYEQTEFLTDALDGATVATDYIQNVNRTNVRDNMQTYAMNLVDWIRTNNYSASVDDILGGRTIVPADSFTPQRDETLSYEAPEDEPTEYDEEIPSSFDVDVRVQINGIDETFASREIYGIPLYITYSGSFEPKLYLNDTLIATGSAMATLAVNGSITVTHKAYSTTFADFVHSHTFQRNQTVEMIGAGFGSAGGGMAALHREKFDEAVLVNTPVSFPAVFKHSLSYAGYSELASFSMMYDIMDRIANCKTAVHTSINMISWNVRIGQSWACMIATSSLDGNTDLAAALRFNGAGNTLEQSGFQQTFLNVNMVNVKRQVDRANELGYKFYDATSSNWLTDVKPNLTSYDSGTIDTIENTFLPLGLRVVLPDHGHIPIGSYYWDAYQVAGYGYWSDKVFQFNGGASEGACAGGVKGGRKKGSKTTAGDPVDAQTGEFRTRIEGIKVGSGKFPYSLEFNHVYRSGMNNVPSPMGLGWTHNFAMTARPTSDPYQCLGEDSPISAAASIAYLYLSVDLFSDLTNPVTKLIPHAIAGRWWADVVTDNIVMVDTVEELLAFNRLADGSYNPPVGHAGTLVLDGGVYTYTTPQQVQLVFNAAGCISQLVHPNGVTLDFTYDSGTNRLLESVTNNMGRTLTLTYSTLSAYPYLTEVSDGNGRSIECAFSSSIGNGARKLLTVTDAESNDTTFTYDVKNRLESCFYPAFPVNAFITNTYDSLGRVETQQHGAREFNFYLSGQRNAVLDGDDVGSVFYFDRTGNRIWHRDPSLYWHYRAYDALGRLIETSDDTDQKIFSYDEKNNLLSKVHYPKIWSIATPIETSWTYHSVYNKPLTFTDGRSNTTTFTYDIDTGNLLTVERPEVDSQIPTVTYTYNERGQVLTREDETGIVTEFIYDTGTEKLLSAIVDSGSSPHLNLTTNFDYDAVGNVISVEDPRGNTTTFDFDDERRLIQKIAPTPFEFVTNYGYDENGNRTSIERETGDVGHPWQTYSATYSPTNKRLLVTDPVDKTVEYQYDDHERLWKIIRQVGDSEFRTTTLAYDASGRIYTVTDPSNTISQTRLYTPTGKLFQLADARNNTTQFDYDEFDRLAVTWYPDSTGEFNWLRDENGNVLQYYTRTTNQLIEFEYDALNRIKTKTPDGQAVVSYEYDLAGRRTLVSTPAVMGDPSSGDFEYSFDSAGRFFKETTPDSKEIVRELDQNGNITKLTYPDSWYCEYFFDELNRMTDIKLNGSMSAAAHMDYDDLSRRTTLTFGNGAVVNYGREWNNALTSLEHVFNMSDDVTFGYGFNDARQLTSHSVTDSTFLWHPSATYTIAYDTANSVNEYPEVDSIGYSYNDSGCLTSDGTWSFAYDAENHLISADKTAVSASYLYDGLHRQIQKEVNSSKTRFVYDGWQRIADYNGSDVLQNRFVYGAGLDEALMQVSSGGTLTYLHADKLGSVVCTTDGSGNVSNKRQYSPFGETSSFSGPSFGFTGQRFDSETGLYFYKMRYYSPALGRFLQPDPIGLAGGANLYGYVGNDPLTFVDPYGLVWMFGPLPPEEPDDWIEEEEEFEGWDENPEVYRRAIVRSKGSIKLVNQPLMQDGSGTGAGETVPKPGDPGFIGPVNIKDPERPENRWRLIPPKPLLERLDAIRNSPWYAELAREIWKEYQEYNGHESKNYTGTQPWPGGEVQDPFGYLADPEE